MSIPLPSKPIRAVVFDLDGLLLNTEDLYEIAGQQILHARGQTMNDELREAMMGLPSLKSLTLLIDTFGLDDTPEALYEECEQMMNELYHSHLQPMPGLADLLDKIACAELRRAVATSGYREYASRLLSRVSIDHHFSFVLTADDITHGKPAPDVYLMAASRLEIEPSEMMVLEDSSNGCRAGIAAGAYTVAVPNRHTAKHDFTGAAIVADTLADQKILSALSL